jgi:very-short-patch-repair endonuclease
MTYGILCLRGSIVNKEKIMVKAIETIYVAGKMQNDDWRLDLFDEYNRSNDHAHQWGCNPLTIAYDGTWPEHSHMHICGLRYTGPFFVDNLGGHGFSCFEKDEHGGNINSPSHSAKLIGRRQEVQQWCLHAIEKADLVLAWIDCIDCYGTIAEIGYAKALRKIIVIAGPRRYDDLWFVYHMGDLIHFLYGGASLRHILKSSLYELRRLEPHFDSPIEQVFWDAWCGPFRDQGGDEEWAIKLIPQYHIGSYRVDFAHVETKTAIELDGHATHSSPDAIAYDRKRQREIESQGWRVIRFGGKEIFENVGKCVVEVYGILKSNTRSISH